MDYRSKKKIFLFQGFPLGCVMQEVSDCNSKIKWVYTDSFLAPDHLLYLQLFDLTPLTPVIEFIKNWSLQKMQIRFKKC